MKTQLMRWAALGHLVDNLEKKRTKKDTESTKTLLRKFPVSGNSQVDNLDKEAFEFSIRRAVIKTALQIQAV